MLYENLICLKIISLNMNRIDEAVKLFEEGYVCSQAVFAVFSEDYGISKSDALKIGACFGSGMRKGEVCGACTGALMALGLKYGDDKARSNEACERFLDEFGDVNGSYICRDLLGCDISTEEGVKYAIENNLFREFCPKMVESATEIAEKLMDGD
jgi:C_GCAxxG_C_C family probable redox protein